MRNERQCFQVYRQPIPVQDLVLEDLQDGDVRMGGSFRGAFSNSDKGELCLRFLISAVLGADKKRDINLLKTDINLFILTLFSVLLQPRTSSVCVSRTLCRVSLTHFKSTTSFTSSSGLTACAVPCPSSRATPPPTPAPIAAPPQPPQPSTWRRRTRTSLKAMSLPAPHLPPPQHHRPHPQHPHHPRHLARQGNLKRTSAFSALWARGRKPWCRELSSSTWTRSSSQSGLVFMCVLEPSGSTAVFCVSVLNGSYIPFNTR